MTTEYSEAEIQRFYDVAIELVIKAGNFIVNVISKEKTISVKSNPTDLVTETDKAVEVMLFDGLRKEFPGHKFIGEESTADNADFIEPLSNDPTWIVDPIDGTMNFVHSHPMCCISVGLVINKEIIIGIIYAPIIDQMYTAIKGKGAKLNQKQIKVSSCNELNKAMVLMDIHTCDGDQSNNIQVNNLAIMMSKVQAFRSIGSAAICLALVASGSADIYFHPGGLHCWDMVAGALLVKEAGGYVCDSVLGGSFDYMSRRITVCSSKPLWDQFMALKLQLVEKKRDSPEVCGL